MKMWLECREDFQAEALGQAVCGDSEQCQQKQLDAARPPLKSCALFQHSRKA